MSAGERRLSQRVKHLILLEDNRDVAAMLARLLGELGYYVTCATRTADACEVLERVKVDLLIADHASPGWHLLRRRGHRRAKSLPYILMTGDGDQMAQLQTNGALHLSKPFRLIAFMDEVRSRIGPGDGEGRN